MRNLTVLQIGGLASDILAENPSGKVAGVTSGGIFLMADKHVLFLTAADYKSPYNLQTEGLGSVLNLVQPGDEWTLADGQILLNKPQLLINFGSALNWQPKPLTRVETSISERLERITEIVSRLHEIDSSKGWIFLANSREADTNTESQRIFDLAERFIRVVWEENMTACLTASQSILGLGGGLTPSGDDWLTGFFLYHSRITQAGEPQSDFLVELAKRINSMAFERTTKISANRIQAACRGWAEELFLDVIDALVTADKKLSDDQLFTLVKFGHSSGVDTVMGMYSALKILC